MKKIRIPISRTVPLPEQIEKLIDTEVFQRLRGVKQLGPTEFVFPGATHTRFEHSLGVYALACRYLDKLCTVESFKGAYPEARTISNLIILCALLHDVGHYPFSHWIEELGQFHGSIKIESHEDRLLKLLQKGSLASFIWNDFRIRPESICRVISKRPESKEEILATSVIDSVLDVDKLDYLRRDSIHCGVDYGHGLDPDRLLDGLYFRPEANCICLNDKARNYVMSLLACRNLMYQEVYWHKTIRSCTAMIKRAFYELVVNALIDSENLERLLGSTDTRFIDDLVSIAEKKKPEILRLLSPFAYRGRSLYKVAFHFHDQQTIRSPLTRNFLGSLAKERDYGILVARSNAVAAAIRKRLNAEIADTDVLIENTPVKEDGGERYDLANLEIWNRRTHAYEHSPAKVNELNEFLAANRQVFILMNATLRDQLQDLTQDVWSEIFAESQK